MQKNLVFPIMFIHYQILREPLPNSRNFYRVHVYLAIVYHTPFQSSHHGVCFVIVRFNIKHKYYLWRVLTVSPLLQCVGKIQS